MSKLLFLLLSITYGVVNLKNLKLIGGIEYLEILWHAEDLDEDTLIARLACSSSSLQGTIRTRVYHAYILWAPLQLASLDYL